MFVRGRPRECEREYESVCVYEREREIDLRDVARVCERAREGACATVDEHADPEDVVPNSHLVFGKPLPHKT